MKTKLHTLLLLLFFTTGHANAQWELQLDLNMFTDVGKIHFVNETHGWTAGGVLSGSSCLYTTNGGKNWYWQPTAGDGFDIFFVNLDTGFLSTWDGIIRKTVDGGQTWRNIQTPISGYIYTLQFVDEYTGWAEVGRKILHTNDGGENWTIQVVGSITPEHVSFHFLNSSVGWAIKEGMRCSLWKTNNGGNEWDSIFNWSKDYSFNKIYFVNEQLGWLLGSLSDTLFLGQTVDGGYTWSEKKLPYSYIYEYMELTDIQFVNDTLGWITCRPRSGIMGLVLVTTDGGITWFRQKVNTNYESGRENCNCRDAFWDICMVSPKKGWIAADDCIYTTNNADSILSLFQKENFNSELSIYPNPFKDCVSIELPQYEHGKPSKVTISSIDGKMLLQQDFPNNYTLNLNFLNQGIYFLTVYFDNLSKNYYLTRKIIKL